MKRFDEKNVVFVLFYSFVHNQNETFATIILI